jgi:hypothetical protein
MHAQPRRYAEPTGWTGWITFAAFMMVTIGILHVVEGLVALFKDSYFIVGKSGLVVSADYTAWGWTHIILGGVVGLAGVGLLMGQMWARTVGVVVALISALVNFAFIAAYPLWSCILIAVDVLVVYSIIVHGREVRDRI